MKYMQLLDCVHQTFNPETMPPQQLEPGQPGSQVLPVATDSQPLGGVRVPCYGDQLTLTCFAGARDLRAGCHSAKQRLDHLFQSALWIIGIPREVS